MEAGAESQTLEAACTEVSDSSAVSSCGPGSSALRAYEVSCQARYCAAMAAAIHTCQCDRAPEVKTKSPAQPRSLPRRQIPNDAQLIEVIVSRYAATRAARLFLTARREISVPCPRRIRTIMFSGFHSHYSRC